MEKAGLGHTQYFIQSPEDEQRALRDGWAGPRLDQFRRKERNLPLDGVFDSQAGIVQADLACNYALRLVEAAGAITFFGEGRGEFLTFIRDEKDNHQIKGIITRDQQRHHADLVIIAAGAHSHQIVPELQSFLTATAGNFVYIKVPQELKHRFEAKVFPPWTWNYTGASDGGGLGGFPLDRKFLLYLVAFVTLRK
ncbi:unnamed protein product [Clonostachys byssicola]|uniref:Uncharacterized protein n=1 Tax=Clonostachys byssicola TaxID=160290 RepID=A0A9N9U4D7_9HYPO|nr:unnamed protein product [Clonostachys byssicola]